MQAPALPRHTLSKSTFMYGCQCPKRLWLHKYKPELRNEEDEERNAIFQRGTDVGMLARQLFPGGADATPKDSYSYQQSVMDTARFIKEGKTVIYEAAFQFNGILCAVDMLVKIKGKWYAYEVKSTCSVKETHVMDAALQHYVITNAGLPLQDIAIIHLNNKYIRSGDLDIQQLFCVQSVLEEVKVQQLFIEIKQQELKKVLQLKQAPPMIVGGQCDKPYPCDFSTYCNKEFGEIGMNYGVARMDKPAIRDFVKQLEYPLYFMDFETWMAAVPERDRHWPYRQVTFQYSVHVQVAPGSSLQHYAYLAEDTTSSQDDFIKNLLSVTGSKGSVIVYNKTFENCRLNELKTDFPKMSKKINALQSRMIDLMQPFRNRSYYLPEMQGSYSIKYVLPALCPELSYDTLPICNGSDASAAFYNLKNETDLEKRSTTREALLEYCKLDTIAMLKILEKLTRCIQGRLIKM